MTSDDWDEPEEYDDYDGEEDEPMSKHIVVASKEAGIELMTEWLKTKARGINFALLMDDEGVLKVYYRNEQPCFGELRTYGPKSTAPDVYKPSDLHHPFPDGHPIAVGTNFGWNGEWLDIAITPESSPWHSVLKEFITFDSERGKCIIITDTHIDPTIMVHMFRMINYNSSFESVFQKLKTIFPDEMASLLWVMTPSINFPLNNHFTINTYDYGNWSGNSPDFKLIFHRTPKEITGGTFYERWAYNRPDIDYIFGKGVTNIYNETNKICEKGQYSYFKIEGLPKVLELFKGWYKNAMVLE